MAFDCTNLCRTCLTNNRNSQSLFSLQQSQQQPLRSLLTECTSLTVEENDGFPESICENCVEKLYKAFEFKKLCENSYNNLRIWLESRDEIESEKMSYFECNDANNDDQSSEIGSNINEYIDQEDNNKEECNKSCVECKENFIELKAYSRHMIKVHNKCIKCNMELKTLKKHKCKSRVDKTIKKKAKRPRSQASTCDICSKTFRFHSNLERHKIIHTGEKPYLCNVCGKGFAQLSYLKIHSFIHTGEKPYKCNMCEKSFGAPGTLITHTRIHTGERPHICKICGKNFQQSGYLRTHIRTHTGEKPIECKVCQKRFNQSGKLVIHMRIHSGEKPYSCKDCGRCFAVKGTLKKHIRTHTGERPYICSVCGQTFAQNGTLSTHMKIHKSRDDNVV